MIGCQDIKHQKLTGKGWSPRVCTEIGRVFVFELVCLYQSKGSKVVTEGFDASLVHNQACKYFPYLQLTIDN